MSEEITIREQQEALPMSTNEIVRQVCLIQDVMKTVMRDKEHYGIIPGCGNKPTLLKPGAEKLGMTFRLHPEFEVTRHELPGGHREVEVLCTLKTFSGKFAGQGVGSCSTLENKYRYRWENTGMLVPVNYWESRDPAMLGGADYAPRKVKGKWTIFHRIEHDNPADYYNTVLKMAKKRAHVDAILTATAASDLFTQDVEDLPVNAEPPPEPEYKDTRKTADAMADMMGGGKEATKGRDDGEPFPAEVEEAAKRTQGTLVDGWQPDDDTSNNGAYRVEVSGRAAFNAKDVLDKEGYAWQANTAKKGGKALVLSGLSHDEMDRQLDWLGKFDPAPYINAYNDKDDVVFSNQK